jgi:hypothetical protein
MNLMGILFSNNAEINMKDVTAIKILVGRSYRMMFIDDRTKHFQDAKPFAYDKGYYYVVCPCCHQIESVSEDYFQDKTKAVIQCRNRTITQKTFFKKKADSIETISGQMKAYNLDLTDWKL